MPPKRRQPPTRNSQRDPELRYRRDGGFVHYPGTGPNYRGKMNSAPNNSGGKSELVAAVSAARRMQPDIPPAPAPTAAPTPAPAPSTAAPAPATPAAPATDAPFPGPGRHHHPTYEQRSEMILRTHARISLRLNVFLRGRGQGHGADRFCPPREHPPLPNTLYSEDKRGY